MAKVDQIGPELRVPEDRHSRWMECRDGHPEEGAVTPIRLASAKEGSFSRAPFGAVRVGAVASSELGSFAR